jgi:hypothetical protein
LCAIAITTGLLLPGAVWAQDEAPESPLTIESKLLATTAYVDRGYVVDDNHIHFQPELTLTYTTEIGGISLSPYIGVWADMSGTPAPGDPEWLYEVDSYIGAAMDLGRGFSFDINYTYNNSPANGFDDVHELSVTLSHDDWLHPSVNVIRELDDRNGEEDTYVELKATPGFDVEQVKGLRLDFPLTAGLTPDEFYTDDDGDGSVLGYLEAGIAATYPINDHWSLVAGVDYYWLAADSTQESNDGDESQVVGRVGAAFSY